MARFCTNCGSQMNEGDKVCGQCGTPAAVITPPQPAQEAQPAATPAQPIPPTQATPGSPVTDGNQNSNKIIGIIVAAIVLIVVAVVAANVVGRFTGYKATINKMVKAIQKDDVEDLEKMSSTLSDEYYEYWYGKDYDEYYEEAVSDTLDDFEDEVGKIKKISYEITDSTELSKRRLKELKEELTDDYNMDTDDIKKIVNVELKITVKGSKKSSSFYTDYLFMVKEGSSWKIFYGDLDY